MKEIFKVFEEESFKYEQALKEINYSIFELRDDENNEISQQIGNLICLIDDFYDEFERFLQAKVSLPEELLEKYYEQQNNEKSPSEDTESITQVAEEICTTLSTTMKILDNNTDALVRESCDAFLTQSESGNFAEQEDFALGTQEKETSSSELSDEIEKENNEKLISTVESEDELFGELARDDYSKSTVGEAIIFPMLIKKSSLEYHSNIVSPNALFGSLLISPKYINAILEETITNYPSASQFELNAVYAIVCYFLRYHSQYILDNAVIAPNIEELSFSLPNCPEPPYCLCCCSFEIRKAYVDSIEFIGNIAIPYNFEKLVLPKHSVRQCTLDSRIALEEESEEQINSIFINILQEISNYLNAIIH